MKFLRSICAVGVCRSQRVTKQAFTLVEMLVVLAVIALLALMLPALAGARSQSKKAVCTAQLGRVGAIWLTYANDYEDVLPPAPNGGSWNYLWSELRDEIDSYDVDAAEVFYCPDHIKSKNPSGTEMDWHNPIDNPNYYGSYQTGYNLFTNVVSMNFSAASPSPYHPDNVPWRPADGTDARQLSWSYAWFTADPDLQHIIPAIKTTERKHLVDDIANKIIIPDKAPMAFDKVFSYNSEFDESYCNHVDFATKIPYVMNAVYLDGHVYGRGPTEIGVLRNFGTGSQVWF